MFARLIVLAVSARAHAGMLAVLLASGAIAIAPQLADATATSQPDQPANAAELVVQVGHTSSLSALAFSADATLLATGSWDHSIRLWRVADGAELRAFLGHTNWISAVAISPTGRHLASASLDGTARLWDLRTGRELRRFGLKVAGEDQFTRSTSAAFSGDGRILLTADQTVNKTSAVHLWDVETGASIQEFRLSSGAISVATFTPDARLILAGTDDGVLQIWDRKTGDRKTLKGHRDGIVSVSVSADGRLAATSTGGFGENKDYSARLWDLSTGREVRRFTEDIGINSVALSPDGKYLLVVAGMAQLLDVVTGKGVGDQPNFSCLEDTGAEVAAFAPDARQFAIGCSSEIGLATVWKVDGTEVGSLIHGLTSPAEAIAVSGDGTMIATAGETITNDHLNVNLWDVSAGGERTRLRGDEDGVDALDFSPDGRYLLTGGKDAIARMWDVQNGAEVRRFEGHASEITAVRFSADGRVVITGSGPGMPDVDKSKKADSSVRVWDANTGRLLQTLQHPQTVTAIDVTPDGRFVLSGSQDWTARLWLARTGQQIAEFKYGTLGKPGHSADVNAVALSPDGRFVLTGTGDMLTEAGVYLWDVESGKGIRSFSGHTAAVRSVRFSPDGRTALTAADDNTVRVWDTASGRELHRLMHPAPVASAVWMKNAEFIASVGTEGATHVWDASSGVELCRLISLWDGRWVVVDPLGRFDSSDLERVDGLRWVRPRDPFTPLPLEIFMRDYFEPRLLTRVVQHAPLGKVRPLTQLNTLQPLVKITDIRPGPTASTVRVSVQVSSQRAADQEPGAGESGASDLRLFRDGRLVGYAPLEDGALALDGATRQAMFTFPAVRLASHSTGNQVEFSAYAFNTDRVKSATDRKTFQLTEHQTRRRRAYVLSVGVNAYENSQLNLSFAAPDARRMANVLRDSLIGSGQFEDVTVIRLISDIEAGRASPEEAPATKANILAVLETLAGRAPVPPSIAGLSGADGLRAATPDDLVVISFSGHGFADDSGVFYLVPHDTSDGANMPAQLQSHALSSDELSRALRDLDAGELTLIVDACHSAAAVQSGEFRPGPMGSRGLGQLAYDKGMRVLAATQTDNVALEDQRIGHGLLTFALVHDGLESKLADFKPKDGAITMAEWLSYAVDRVPQLYDEIRRGSRRTAGTSPNGERGLTLEPAWVQKPALFDFARGRAEVLAK